MVLEFLSLLCRVSYSADRVVSTEFSEGTDVDVEEDFVEIGDTDLLDDDSVQCGTEFCVISNVDTEKYLLTLLLASGYVYNAELRNIDAKCV